MKVVCATDRLPKSEAAIERAAFLSMGLDADLTLLHVVEPAHSERILEQTLENALRQMDSRTRAPLWRAPLKPTISLRVGNPARLIVEDIKQSNAQLLVLGPHRKRPLRDALEGTIAAKALAARTCPVLIVRDEAEGPYRRVLLALDVSPASGAAIRAAESLVITPEVDARIIHAHEPPDEALRRDLGVAWDAIADLVRGTKYAETAVRDFLKAESMDPERYDVRIARTSPASAILRAAEQHEPSLLVMGTRGRGRLHQALVGSVANRVLHGATCDVLIVPEGSFDEAKRKRGAAEVASGSLRSRGRAPAAHTVGA
jgi:nucleotide-binding universal stress UspA family protein